MKAGIFAVPLMVLAQPALAEPLQLNGKFGYLGEYELRANVPSDVVSGQTAYSGSMRVKHVGLCSHNGRDEVDGKIELQFADAGSRITATLVFDGRECSFRGELSEVEGGELVCSSGTVPFRLWLR